MPILRIPDILGAMDGFELRTHPDERQISRETNEWFARFAFPIFRTCAFRLTLAIVSSYNMLPRDKFDEFVKSEFGLLVGMAYPDTDTTRLRVTSDYMSILFTYDDLMDLPSSELMHDQMGADKAAKVMMSVLTEPLKFRPVPGLPVATAFHEYVIVHHCFRYRPDRRCSFWMRFCATSTRAMQRRFTEATHEYVLAARNQVGNRERKECPTIEEYVSLRRDTSAIKVSALRMVFLVH